MKKLTPLLFFLVAGPLWAACTGSSPSWNSTPDFASVSACVTSAQPGDTINVSAGIATWASSLDVRKGVKLIGAGIGNTRIVRGGSQILTYFPSNYGLNAPFRLSGFSLDGNGGQIMYLGEDGKAAPFTAQTNIRIDNNLFYSSVAVDENSQAITYRSALYGVVDNNSFESYPYPARNANTAYGPSYWDNQAVAGFGWALGDQYKLYFEDNVFNFGTGWLYNVLTDAQFSGRYAFRYNTITAVKGAWPLFDMHGVQGEGSSGMYASFGAEMYGNRANNVGGTFIEFRAGKSVVFNNSFNGAMSLETSSSVVTCPNSYTEGQMVHDTYFWRNRNQYTGSLVTAGNDDAGINCNGHVRPARGIDFYDDSSSPGVGCGTARSSTCSTGQGYWETNQSCSDLTGMVGAHPATPISGTLYKCVSPNTWSAFFTPYPYPHPLRGSQAPLNPPTNLRVL